MKTLTKNKAPEAENASKFLNSQSCGIKFKS